MALLLFSAGLALAADETVTISKARLEELEREEAELRALKAKLGQSSYAPGSAEKSKPSPGGAGLITSAPIAPARPAESPPPPPPPAPAPASPPTPAQPAPAIASLPPLKEGEAVDAAEVAAHYAADPVSADKRYARRTIKIRGEIERFETVPLTRDYRIVLRTAERQTMVVCHIITPEQFKAVFTVRNGSELTGLTEADKRLPIAKTRQTAIIEGVCKGMSEGVVRLTRGHLLEIRS